MNYECSTEVRTLIDLVNMTVNYHLGEIKATGKSLDDIRASLDYRLRWPKWIGVRLQHAHHFMPFLEFHRWVWTGEIVPRPSVKKGKEKWIINGRPATASEIDAALKNDALLRLGSWEAEWSLDGKPATLDEIEDAERKYEDYPKTEIEDALRRYNMIRVARKMLQTIVDLSEQPDPKRSIDGIKLVEGHHEYRIRIVGTRYDPELKDVLNKCAARIRKCEAIKCLKFVWAGRSDTKGCSVKCSKAIRTARRRKRSTLGRVGFARQKRSGK